MVQSASLALYLAEWFAGSLAHSEAGTQDRGLPRQKLDRLHRLVTSKMGADEPALKTLEREVVENGEPSPRTVSRVDQVIAVLRAADPDFDSTLGEAVRDLEKSTAAPAKADNIKVESNRSHGVQVGSRNSQTNFYGDTSVGHERDIRIQIIDKSQLDDLGSSGAAFTAEIYCHGRPRSLQLTVDGYPPEVAAISPRTLDVSDSIVGHVQIHLRVTSTRPAGGSRTVRLVARDNQAPDLRWLSNEIKVTVPENPKLEISPTGEVAENEHRAAFPGAGCLITVSVKNCGNVPLHGRVIIAGHSEHLGSQAVVLDEEWASSHNSGAFSVSPGNAAETHVPLLVRRAALTKHVEFSLSAQFAWNNQEVNGFSSHFSLKCPGLLAGMWKEIVSWIDSGYWRAREVVRRHAVRGPGGQVRGVSIPATVSVVLIVALIGVAGGFFLRGQSSGVAAESNSGRPEGSLPGSLVASSRSGVVGQSRPVLPTPDGYARISCQSGQSVAFLKAIRPQEGEYEGSEDVLIRYLFGLENQRINKSDIGSVLRDAGLPSEVHISKGDTICGTALKNYPGADDRWRFLWIGPFSDSEAGKVCDLLGKPMDWDCGTAKVGP